MEAFEEYFGDKYGNRERMERSSSNDSAISHITSYNELRKESIAIS